VSKVDKKERDVEAYTDVALEAARQAWQEFEEGKDPGFVINRDAGARTVELVLDLIHMVQQEREARRARGGVA
jgi:hypothetical protein